MEEWKRGWHARGRTLTGAPTCLHPSSRPSFNLTYHHHPPGANIVKIIGAAPNLLSYDIEGSLAVKVRHLHTLLPRADVVKLISYAPTLLYHDTETSIAPKLRCVHAESFVCLSVCLSGRIQEAHTHTD